MNSMAANNAARPGHIDWLTLAALAALAYVLATAFHEHAGHAAACVALGGSPSKLGAFYVECNYGAMGTAGVRLVAIAGPAASLLLGLLSSRLLRSARTPSVRLFWWLMASVGLMTAFGYLLFSAVSGIGDLGTGDEGALKGVPMPWLWRVAMGAVGYWLYDRSVVWSMTALAGVVGGCEDRAARVRRTALVCYVAGAATCIAIGLFNPEGIVIVLTSAAAASLGGTSGFAWGPYRTRIGAGDSDAVACPRSWSWMVASLVVVLAYAAVFGPTIVR